MYISQNGISNNPYGGEFGVVPLQIGSTKGFGRFPTVTEAALVCYANSGAVPGIATSVQCFLLLNL
ncbi:MAG: hypothetical protein WDN28_21360 [Chthoniobacter sp.]